MYSTNNLLEVKMLKFIDHTRMGRGQHGWLDSHFHFSFAEYFNPANMQFGVLRVLNDDEVQQGEGFDTHPHKDMEIISYVVNGELTHKDSMGNESALTRGQVQYMSAGTGVFHSEYNHGKDLLRFLQIWILPDAKNYKPNYGDYRFKLEDRVEKWMPIASSTGNNESNAPVRIHSDINMYASIVPAGKNIEFKTGKGRQAYLVLIEGKAEINGIKMQMRDALEITEEDLHITAVDESHFIVIEMEKQKD
jgi:redox-sensitive bicupin YhaK (pirin superfamily)